MTLQLLRLEDNSALALCGSCIARRQKATQLQSEVLQVVPEPKSYCRDCGVCPDLPWVTVKDRLPEDGASVEWLPAKGHTPVAGFYRQHVERKEGGTPIIEKAWVLFCGQRLFTTPRLWRPRLEN